MHRFYPSQPLRGAVLLAQMLGQTTALRFGQLRQQVKSDGEVAARIQTNDFAATSPSLVKTKSLQAKKPFNHVIPL